jgi:hypothetical protein
MQHNIYASKKRLAWGRHFMTQYLFLDTDIHVLIDITQRNLFDEVDHLNDTAILSRSNEEWLKYFIDKYTISVPTLDTTKAELTKATTEGLKYPLRKREDAPQTYKLPEKPKPLAPKPVPKASTAQAEQEFTLSEEDYQEILRICASMSLVMERSPTVFEGAEARAQGSLRSWLKQGSLRSWLK